MNSIMIISKPNMTTNRDTYSLVYEIKSQNVYDSFSKNKESSDFSNYSAKSNYYNDWNVIILLSQNIAIIQTHKLLVKWMVKWVVLVLKNLLHEIPECA